MKKCTRCGVTKTLSEFNKDVHTPDGLTANCRACVQLPSPAKIREKELSDLTNSWLMGKI